MQIVEIANIDYFDQVKTAYDAVYSADPYAQVFLSWTWLRGWFEMTPYPWIVLGLRMNAMSPFVAFLPLTKRGPRIFGFSPINLMYMGGRPHAWTTGFVCLPEIQEETLAAFADYIANDIEWDRFYMDNVFDPRLSIFPSHFSSNAFEFDVKDSMPSVYISLPRSWHEYLSGLGSATRSDLLSNTRRIERQNDIYLSHNRQDHIEADLGALLEMWQQRWGKQPLANLEKRILRYCFDQGNLWISALWQDATPLAALAVILDRQKKTIHQYVTAYNPRFGKLSPGIVLLGSSIRFAIENGFQRCDLLLGAYSYKLRFGAQQQTTKRAIITRKNLRGSLITKAAALYAQLRMR